MKSIKGSIALCLLLFLFQSVSVSAQTVLDPSDPVITYDPANPPTEPAFGQIGKWVRTVRLGWNTEPYKAYIYKGVPFRLLYPRSYNPVANDGKKYPMMVFFHGLGEAGPKTDNEFQLYLGADYFRYAQDIGNYDGYVIFLQSEGFWGAGHFDYIKEIIEYMAANNKLDQFRVAAHGLSAGGAASWEMFFRHPSYISAVLPMSSVAYSYADSQVVNKVKFTPFWNIHGGLDGSPAPSTAFSVRDAMQAKGANYKNTFYPDLGHDTWNRTWNEPDFWSFLMKRPYASNPWPLYGRTEFCPAEAISDTLGLTTGFDAYEWRKDGVTIPGAVGNTYIATATGTYSARVRRGSTWSEWSPIPVVITVKAATVTPPISVSNGASRALPGLDGSTSIQLEVPAGYVTYDWQKEGNGTTLSSSRYLTVTTPGDYKVRVTEQFGCSSNFSPLFRVVDANGTPKPDAPTNLLATVLSQTAIRLDWNETPNPVVNETAFEIYVSNQPGGPYTLAGVTAQNTRTITLNGLTPATTYYYRVRAIGSTGVSAFTNEASGKTQSDVTSPTSPVNLQIADITSTTVTLSWGAATDDVGIAKYEVYINGALTYITTQTTFLVTNLTTNNGYVFKVRSVDGSGNFSPFSNQVAATPSYGLNYKYYTYAGSWNTLPNFNNLTPVSTGNMQNVSLAKRTQDDNFAYLWEGYIKIPATGVYYFRTRSDDGSKLYLGTLGGTTSPYNYGGTALVNNDGLHPSIDVTSAPITLTAGVYPIAIAFYEEGGPEEVVVSWNTPESNNTFVPIPNIAFTTQPGSPAIPAKPTSLVANAASATKIDLAWSDNSNNETGFEIWRSLSPFTNFSVVGTATANATTYSDSNLVPNKRYYYKIRAVNAAGESPFDLAGQGVDYSYYEMDGLSSLPPIATFNSATPKKTGRWNNFDLGLQDRVDNFQFKYTSVITVPTTGTYTFYLTSDDGSKLYVKGFSDANLVVNNDGQHGPVEISGSVNLTRGSHAIYLTYFESGAGETLSLRISGPGIIKQPIPDSWLGNPFANAFTTATTPAPSMPAGIVASGTSTTTTQITWQDKSATEAGFEIQRSTDNGVTFLPLGVTAANTTSYIDTGLFANAVYYYRVRSTGPVNNSAFATPDSAKTWDMKPVIQKLASRTARYGVTTAITIAATDADGDALSFSGQNLPAFAQVTNNGDRTATLTLTPSAAQQGVYNAVRIIVSDPNGGSDTTEFNLTVNDNFDPVIAAISPKAVDENATLNVALSATDGNAGDVINWSVSGVPANYTLTPGANGSATLAITPTYASAGVYTITVNVADGKGGFDSKQFSLTVKDKDPNLRVYARIRHDAANNAPAPWNNITASSTSNLVDVNGEPTSVGLSFPNGYNTGNAGVGTGTNSGVYPDAVLKDYFVFGAWWMPQTGTAVLSGLTAGRKYSVTLLGNSNWNIAPDNGFTKYTVGGVTDSLYVQNNTQNTVTFSNVSPASDGTITIAIAKGSTAAAGFLNSIVLESRYQDGTVPQAPTSLFAKYTLGKGAELKWKDNAYNETGFEVWRSTSSSGPFALVGTVSIPDSTGFTDANALGNTTYYYYVRATNATGASANSNTVILATPNRLPTIAPISNVVMKTGQTKVVTISVADDPGTPITIGVTGLPAFALFTDNGNGTGSITIQPNSGSMGFYKGITVTAKDQYNATTTAVFDITVNDQLLTSVYLNFTADTASAPKPWNNLINPQFANSQFSSLRDDNEALTSITLTVQDGFEWIQAQGMRPRNGREVFPETVMRVGLIESSLNTKRLLISGLSAAKRYNFVFFNSRDDGRTGNTKFAIGSQSVSLDAGYNINRTAQINGIQANSNGEVTIEVSKVAGNDYAFLNGLIIQSYDASLADLLAPSGLRITRTTKSSIDLQWQDRTPDETGFEIWRAIDGSSNYSLLTTTGPGVGSYNDAGLSAGRTYYYLVRTKKGAVVSAFSNTVKSTTITYSVYLNFNSTAPAPGLPWNSTNGRPEIGDTYNNLKNDLGASSSLGMVLQTSWSGMYGAGVNTGNNSGIYPDNVMLESYGNFPGVTATLRITGLDLGMKYNFTFFGSSVDTRDINAIYTVNGKQAILNASLNKSTSITIYDVVANTNGEALVTVSAAPGSELGLLGALVIEAYKESAASAPVTPSARVVQPEVFVGNMVAEQDKSIYAYPNPFREYFTIVASGLNGAKAEVRLYDAGGKLVHQQAAGALINGANLIKVQPGHLTTGMYQMVLYVNGRIEKTFKVVKQ